MSVFETAMDALFKDQNLAKTATFIPKNGPNKEVQVVTKSPDLYPAFGQSLVETPSLVLEVRYADCPRVKADDQFRIAAVTYQVQGEPRRDVDRLIWLVDVYET
jgi:hypothetical protein